MDISGCAWSRLTDEAIDEVDLAIALAHELRGAARRAGAGTPGVQARLGGLGGLELRRAWFVDGWCVGGAGIAAGIRGVRVAGAGDRGVDGGTRRTGGPVGAGGAG